MNRDTAVVTVAVLSAILAVGCIAMAVAHAGVEVPVLSRFGPGGDRAVPPAVIVFTIGALLLGVIAFGTLRRRAWAWAGGTVVHALVVLGAVMPYRGVGSLVAIVLAGLALAVLLSRPARSALLPAR